MKKRNSKNWRNFSSNSDPDRGPRNRLERSKSVCHMTESYYRLFRSGLSEFYNREAVTMRFDVIWRDFEHEQRLNSEGN